MLKYGINNVRGGSYTQINLPECNIISLEKELCSASNLCFTGAGGHFFFFVMPSVKFLAAYVHLALRNSVHAPNSTHSSQYAIS